jgi:tRNA nucleotidyltransferase (CCA-adding enzyme)
VPEHSGYHVLKLAEKDRCGLSDPVTGEGLYVPAAPSAVEWMRWALESRQPGRIFSSLAESGELGLYPELARVVGVPQDPQWHPEGPVDIHTGHVLDAAAEIASREGLDGEARTVLILAALTHDLGKADTTRKRSFGDGTRWTSYGHDRVGVPLARRFLERIGLPEPSIQQVLPLVATHMAYRDFQDPNVRGRTIRRLAERIYPASIRQLVLLIEADHSGRPPLPKALPVAARRMMELAERHGVLDAPQLLNPELPDLRDIA